MLDESRELDFAFDQFRRGAVEGRLPRHAGSVLLPRANSRYKLDTMTVLGFAESSLGKVGFLRHSSFAIRKFQCHSVPIREVNFPCPDRPGVQVRVSSGLGACQVAVNWLTGG